MRPEKVRQDATASTRATIYQFCVAVDKCYKLRDGQKLLIEELGDVTIDGDQQVEVKHYSDKLTDGHHNFWNSLRNWMEDGFDHSPYTSLILHTTQEFGPKTRISEWNCNTPNVRIALLLAINKKFEKAYEKAKVANPKQAASAVLKHQRFVLDPQRLSKLKAIIEKISIEAGSRDLPDLYDELKQDRIRGILNGKKDDFLNSLIGFVCRPGQKAGERWEIRSEEFAAKLEELTNIYKSETRVFPCKHFNKIEAVSPDVDREDLFVRKIHEIQYSEVVVSAIHNYEAAIQTIDEEFTAYRTEPERLKGYSKAVEDRFEHNHRIACRKCSDEVSDSKNLYDETHASQPPDFSGFQDSPDWFRNGLLHIRMNDNKAAFRWRVTKK